MNLFSRQQNKANPDQIKTLKSWVYQVLDLSEDIPIAISQLACTEPGCPPLETVISVMKRPPETYKLHKTVASIRYEDICQLLK